MSPATLTPELLLAHDGFLRALARSLLFDGQAADDVVQQAYLAALKSPPTHAGALRSWLAATVRNMASNFRRGEQHVKAREERAARHEGVPSTADIVEREALRQKVVQVVLALDEPYRSMVLLRYFENLTPKEIAARLELPGGTVRVRLMRALEQLRGRLDALHDGNRTQWSLVLVPLARPMATGAAAAGTLTAASLAFLPWALGLLVLLVGAGIWWWPQPASGAQAPQPATVQSPSDPGPDPGATAAASVPVVPQQPAVVAREPVVAAAGRRAIEPRWLSGFRGRLLRADRSAAARYPVRVVSTDPMRALTADLDPLAAAQPGVRFEAPEALSNDDGTFEVHGMWPHAYYVLTAGTGTDEPLFRPLDRSPGAGEVVDLGDVLLPQLASVAGRVVDDEGQPVAGASVLALDVATALVKELPADLVDSDTLLAWQVDGPFQVSAIPASLRQLVGHLLQCRARTGPDGRFLLRGVPLGSSTLAVASAGHLPLVQTGPSTKAGERTEVGDLRVTEGETLEGQVLDADGRPVPGAHVAAGTAGSSMPVVPLTQRVRADAEGRFRIGGLAAGRVIAAARREGQTRWEAFGPSRAAELDELVLAGTADLTVRIERRDRQPVAAARVRVVPSRQLGHLFALGLLQPEAQEPEDLGEGRFRFRALPQGDWSVLAAAEGCVLSSTDLRLMQPKELPITLTAAHTLPVLVVDPAGAPVADAQVFVEVEGSGPSWSRAYPARRVSGMASFWDHLPYLGVRTDAHGHADLSGLAAGKSVVSVCHPGFAVAAQRIELPQQSLVVTLAQAGTVAGRLTDQGRPAPGKLVVLDAWFNDLPGSVPMREVCAVTDAEGRFAIQNVHPAGYVLGIKGSVDGLTSLGQVVAWFVGGDAFSLGTVRRKVAVRPGETTRIDLDLDPQRAAPGERKITARGTVTLDGRPMTGATVTVMDDTEFSGMWTDDLGAARRGTRARVDDSGAFEMSEIRDAAELTVQIARNGDGSTVWSRRFASAAGALHVSIALTSARVILRLRTDADQPAEGCQVELSGTTPAAGGGRSRCVATADAEGRLVLPDLLQGEYTVAAEWTGADRKFRGRMPRLVVGPDGADLELRLRSTRNLSGSIDPALLPAGGTSHATLRSEGAEGFTLRMHQIQSDGSFAFSALDSGQYTLSFRLGNQEWAEPAPIRLDADVVGRRFQPVRK